MQVSQKPERIRFFFFEWSLKDTVSKNVELRRDDWELFQLDNGL